jgi:hypothetical protein
LKKRLRCLPLEIVERWVVTLMVRDGFSFTLRVPRNLLSTNGGFEANGINRDMPG